MKNIWPSPIRQPLQLTSGSRAARPARQRAAARLHIPVASDETIQPELSPTSPPTWRFAIRASDVAAASDRDHLLMPTVRRASSFHPARWRRRYRPRRCRRCGPVVDDPGVVQRARHRCVRADAIALGRSQRFRRVHRQPAGDVLVLPAVRPFWTTGGRGSRLPGGRRAARPD